MKIKLNIPDEPINSLVQQAIADLKPDIEKALQERLHQLLPTYNLRITADNVVRQLIRDQLPILVHKHITDLLVAEFGDTYRQRGALRQLLLEAATQLAEKP